MSKFYLVTGGTGFIGSALVRYLLEKGYKLRVLDDDSRGSVNRLNALRDEIEFVSADIRDPEAVSEATKGVDGVCHLAFVNGTEFFYSRPEYVLDVGVKGMINVLDACIEHNVSELVLASSSEVYQTPAVVPTDEAVSLSIPDILNPRYSYATGKIISESMAINYGRKFFDRVLVFRPHNVYGPDMGWEHVIPQFALRMKALSAKKEDPLSFPIQGTGDETRAFVYIEDFANGFGIMMEHGEHLGIYNIGTMEEVTIKQLAHITGQYFGREIKVVPGELAKGGTLRRCPDMAKLISLGFQPSFSLPQGLQPTLQWYDEHAPQENNNPN